ncbi:MAG TPA: UbiA family prenyltransferase [Tepidiformaceae bacterium]|nr:UbiA family prenyltransferase [Tepidiformaceae bacterium]
MTSPRTWFATSRPFSFTAAVVPAVVGSMLAPWDEFTWWTALLAVLGSVLFLAGTNFTNDYFDHKKGTDGPEALGRAGYIQRGILSPRSVFIAGLVCFAAGAAVGIVLCLVVSWELFWVGVASALAGFLYTGWPLHLAYIGLGEIVVFFFMGPTIVMGAYFVQTERWTWDAFIVSLPGDVPAAGCRIRCTRVRVGGWGAPVAGIARIGDVANSLADCAGGARRREPEETEPCALQDGPVAHAVRRADGCGDWPVLGGWVKEGTGGGSPEEGRRPKAGNRPA